MINWMFFRGCESMPLFPRVSVESNQAKDYGMLMDILLSIRFSYLVFNWKPNHVRFSLPPKPLLEARYEKPPYHSMGVSTKEEKRKSLSLVSFSWDRGHFFLTTYTCMFYICRAGVHRPRTPRTENDRIVVRMRPVLSFACNYNTQSWCAVTEECLSPGVMYCAVHCWCGARRNDLFTLVGKREPSYFKSKTVILPLNSFFLI